MNENGIEVKIVKTGTNKIYQKSIGRVIFITYINSAGISNNINQVVTKLYHKPPNKFYYSAGFP